MTGITKDNLSLVSFPDADVLDFVLDMQSRFFSVKCDDGFLDSSEGGKVIHQVVLQIKGFESLKISEFVNEQLKLIDNYSADFALKDICEMDIRDRDVTLKGFSTGRGLWTEYLFSGGELDGYFEA